MPKGHTNNKAGRPKGSHNATTKIWIKLKDDMVGGHAERFNKVLNEATDEQFAELYLRLLNYVKPKINQNYNDNKDSIVVEFKNVSKQFPDEV